MPRPVVIVRPAPGAGSTPGTTLVVKTSYTIESTGETFHEAMQVDAAIYDAFSAIYNEVHDDVYLRNASISQGGAPVRSALTGWPVVIRQATVQSDADEAT